MSILRNFLSEEGIRKLSSGPEVWEQRAPVIGNFLAINQFKRVTLPKIDGVVEVSKTPSGFGIYYAMSSVMSGFRIGGDVVFTSDFDTLSVEDTETQAKMTILSPRGEIIDHSLSDTEHDLVVSLVATSILGKFASICVRSTLEPQLMLEN